MDALIDSVVSKIQAAGGSIVYRALYESLTDREKRDIRSALKLGQQQKKFHADITFQDGAVLHTIRIGERPAQ